MGLIMDYAIGIDIGGTNIKAVCVTTGGQVLQQHSYATEDSPEAKWAVKAEGIIEQIRGSQEGEAVWVGITSPGVARPDVYQ